MKVAVVAHEFSSAGGAEKAACAHVELLRNAGHEVVLIGDFSSWRTDLPGLQTRGIALRRYTDLGTLNPWARLRIAAAGMFSPSVAVRVARFLERERPDVVHLHKVKRLSPALFVALRWARVRVVATHHDHALTCLNSSRVLGNGKPCPLDRCRPGFAIGARCVGGSHALTAYAAIEFGLRRHVVRDLEVVERHAFPSQFLLDRTTGSGLRIKSHIVPNFAEDPAVDAWAVDAGGPPRVLYFGRLSEEKGVALLPEIARQLPGVRVRVVGDGPMRAWLDERARMEPRSGLEVVGPVWGPVLHDEVHRATVVVLPSVCQENAPLAAIEAMAAGRPIVAARVGGLPELVADGRTGLLHTPGDAADAARQVARVLADPLLARRLGDAARAAFEARHTAARHLERTLELYDA